MRSRFPLTLKTKRATIIAVVALYILLFPGIYPLVDHFYFIFGVLPILAAGLLLGFRSAIYTVIAISVIHFGILAGPLGSSPETAFVKSFPLVTLFIGGAVGYLRDLRAELVKQRDELEDRNKRLDEFASIVSHDLRNPLHVAVGQLELARKECDSEHLDAVAESHDRMDSLIDDTLTLTRAREAISEREVIDLSALFEASWSTVETAKATPITETDRVIRADESRLQQLFENLIRNAVEHGGEDVTVTVGNLDNGFYIEDNGPGIPGDKQEEVFEVGYSATETGTGLGLSIVKQIAEAHGWTVGVTRGSNGGARFEFTGVDLISADE